MIDIKDRIAQEKYSKVRDFFVHGKRERRGGGRAPRGGRERRRKGKGRERARARGHAFFRLFFFFHLRLTFFCFPHRFSFADSIPTKKNNPTQTYQELNKIQKKKVNGFRLAEHRRNSSGVRKSSPSKK